MLSKRYESTEVDRRTWLHVPSGTHWSTTYANKHIRTPIAASISFRALNPLCMLGNNLEETFRYPFSYTNAQLSKSPRRPDLHTKVFNSPKMTHVSFKRKTKS